GAQPEGRGTAPAILYALHRVALVAPERPVVLLPSDHYVSDDDAFMARVEGALEAAQTRPSRVILLGIEPVRPETEYGWIEPSELLLGPSPWPLYGVRRFWEKPSAPLAERLAQAGCLWNSFVIVAHPGTLGRLIRGAMPQLVEAFAPLVSRLGTPWEAEAARAVYVALPTTDFSKQVLQARPADLAVLPVSGVEWIDLGDPARVLYVTGFGKGVFKSADGGKTWALKNNGLPAPEPFAWRLARDKNGVLYLVVARRSEDGSFGNSADGGLYRSSDGAERWQRIRLPDGVNGPNGVAIDP